MASLTTLSLIMLIFSMTFPSFSTSRKAISFPSSRKPISFEAKLIHRTSPQSPLYNPNATPAGLIELAVRNSKARGLYFNRRKPDNAVLDDFARANLSVVGGDYVMRYSIGTPPVETFGLPDTGSSLIWLQCLPCVSCYKQIIPIFNPSDSSSYKNVMCADPLCSSTAATDCIYGDSCYYRIKYMDQAFTEGVISTETISLGDNGVTGDVSIPDMVFGCGHYNFDPLEEPNPPGIVGLNNHRSSLVGQLFSEFSYCISSNTSGANSWIRFGIPAILSGPTTPLLSNEHNDAYFLNLEGISINGFQLDIPKWYFKMSENGDAGFVIDTGTTYSLIYTLAFDVLISGVKEAMADDQVPEPDLSPNKWELCYRNMDIRLAPEIVFNFERLAFRLNNSNAWISSSGGLSCLSIIRTTGAISILGLEQQKNVNFGYDLGNEQISMMYMNCPEKLF